MIYFVLTDGKHPFGEDIHERERNIKNNKPDLSEQKGESFAISDLCSPCIQSIVRGRGT